MTAFDYSCWAVAIMLMVPFLWLTLEILAALLPMRRLAEATDDRPRTAVLVPAHNEEAGVGVTVRALVSHLRPGDRVVVIADNCVDRTAEIAGAAGAEVIERNDPTHRGKGYALDFGIRHLKSDPPAVVAVVDADTEVKAWTIDALAAGVGHYGRPVQGVNLLDPPPGAGPGARISAFAFFFKNYVRPRGMDRLGLPCLLYGTGMAMPWTALSQINLAHGDITEDIRLGVELAIRGVPPAFAPDAHVKGTLPTQLAAAGTQRRRWEHGHLSTIFRYVPRLLYHGLRGFRRDLIGLALHLGVPPLAFLFMLGAIAAVVLAVNGPHAPAAILAIVMCLTVLAILLSWYRFGRDRLPAGDLLRFPFYALKKIPLYLSYFVRPQREWIRTDRQGESP